MTSRYDRRITNVYMLYVDELVFICCIYFAISVGMSLTYGRLPMRIRHIGACIVVNETSEAKKIGLSPLSR